jgi:hypothetical protein
MTAPAATRIVRRTTFPVIGDSLFRGLVTRHAKAGPWRLPPRQVILISLRIPQQVFCLFSGFRPATDVQPASVAAPIIDV